MKTKIYIIMLSAMALLVIGAAVIASSFGAKLSYLEREVFKLEKENEELTSTLLNGASLTQVSERAFELGMIKPQNVIYLNQPVVASLQ